MKQYDHICKKAIEVWGKEDQMKMAIGEIGEFLTLFGRMAQNRCTESEIIDEIADVTVMMRQMAHIFGLEKVEERIDIKFNKVKKKLGME